MNDQDKPALKVRHRRVIVTVDAQSHLPQTIELAVAIAAATQSALHGLFVEDVDLLSVTKLPFTQEVPLLGGRPRTLDNRQVQRALDKMASQFRQSLESQARLSTLSCSHSVVRGRKQSLELGDAQEAEFIILGQPLRGSTMSAHMQRILLVADHSSLLIPALEAILDKSRALRTELVVLADPDQAGEEFLASLSILAARYPAVVQVILPLDQLQRILLTRTPSIDCVLASRQLDSELLGQILRLAACPVIVAASASQPAPLLRGGSPDKL